MQLVDAAPLARLLVVLGIAWMLVSAMALAKDPPGRPTEPFRAEHAALAKHLAHLETLVGGLAQASPEEQKKTMGQVVGFLEEHIKPHARWEEQVLYPAVDRHAGSGENRFTATMRHEHRIIERWLGELAQEAEKPKPDVRAFSRRADNLLGLLRAHFEAEEEILLPILDRTLTAEQFEKEIGQPKH